MALKPFFFFFFFLRRYNFREVLAFSTSFFHLVQFLMQSFQFIIFILVISLFTSSSHLFLGLPSDLVSAGDHSYTFFTMLLSGIRCMCPNQRPLTAKSCKDETRVPDALIGTDQLRETTLTENPKSSKAAGVECRASNLASEKSHR